MARIIEFKGQSTLKRAAMNMLVQMISQDEVKDLRAQFEAMDTGGTGMIDMKDNIVEMVESDNDGKKSHFKISWFWGSKVDPVIWT